MSIKSKIEELQSEIEKELGVKARLDINILESANGDISKTRAEEITNKAINNIGGATESWNGYGVYGMSVKGGEVEICVFYTPNNEEGIINGNCKRT